MLKTKKILNKQPNFTAWGNRKKKILSQKGREGNNKTRER